MFWSNNINDETSIMKDNIVYKWLLVEEEYVGEIRGWNM